MDQSPVLIEMDKLGSAAQPRSSPPGTTGDVPSTVPVVQGSINAAVAGESEL